MNIENREDPRDDPPGGRERRHNFELRERLDEIIRLARQLSREGKAMSQAELDGIREIDGPVIIDIQGSSA